MNKVRELREGDSFPNPMVGPVTFSKELCLDISTMTIKKREKPSKNRETYPVSILDYRLN